MKLFTRLDLHNPTQRQLERMKAFGISYVHGMSWIQAKNLINQAVKNKRKR